MFDNDSLAMMIISQQLELLDDAGKRRLTDWFQSKYIHSPESTLHLFEAPPTVPSENVIDKVAYLDNQGDFKVIIRDLKADSVSEAAIRASYVLVSAYCYLMDKEEASSRNVVVPFLKKVGLYSGSMRAALKRESDIIREGDMLSLTNDGINKADKYIGEIQDNSTSGRWNPIRSKAKGAIEII